MGVAVDRQNAAAGLARMRARDEGHHIGNFFDPGRSASRKMEQYFSLAICVLRGPAPPWSFGGAPVSRSRFGPD